MKEYTQYSILLLTDLIKQIVSCENNEELMIILESAETRCSEMKKFIKKNTVVEHSTTNKK